MNRVQRFGPVVAIAMVILVAAASCVDFNAPAAPKVPDIAIATPSFSKDIQPIFNARCATSGCHNEATHQFDLDLASGYAYASLVGVQSVLDPDYVRVNPNTPVPDSSWIVHMIVATDSARTAIGAPRMPLGLTPLTANQIGNIERWIEEGAPDN